MHEPNVKIEQAGVSKGAKRQYMPFYIKWTCPKCEEDCETDDNGTYPIRLWAGSPE